MASRPKRVVVIGLDSAPTKLIDTHLAEGCLRTIQNLFDGGVVTDNCLVPCPTITPRNCRHSRGSQ